MELAMAPQILIQTRYLLPLCNTLLNRNKFSCRQLLDRNWQLTDFFIPDIQIGGLIAGSYDRLI